MVDLTIPRRHTTSISGMTDPTAVFAFGYPSVISSTSLLCLVPDSKRRIAAEQVPGGGETAGGYFMDSHSITWHQIPDLRVPILAKFRNCGAMSERQEYFDRGFLVGLNQKEQPAFVLLLLRESGFVGVAVIPNCVIDPNLFP